MFTNGLFWSGRRQKSNVYIRRRQGAKCAHRALETWFITNLFSHGAAFYTLHGKNVNVMLELFIYLCCCCCCCYCLNTFVLSFPTLNVSDLCNCCGIFLAHLSTRCSRWAIVITLCPSSVVCHQQFIQSTSPPKPLVQFQNNFTQMFPWCPFTKMLKWFRFAEQNGRQS